MKEHAQGSTDIPTELEVMVKEEALKIVRAKFDNLDGSVELYNLVETFN